jgi:uncharacterized membrane protein YkvA (DUF1232 family)
MTTKTTEDDYSEHYSDESFWGKIKKYGKKAGVNVVYTALLLYYTLIKPTTPAWAKGIIISALGYFILPVDLIPDLIPGGYVDDFSGLIGALLAVAMYIDDESKKLAKDRIETWFGSDALKDIEFIDEKLNKKDPEDDKD